MEGRGTVVERAVRRPQHCPGRGNSVQDWNRGSGNEEKWEAQGTFWEELARTPRCYVAALTTGYTASGWSPSNP